MVGGQQRSSSNSAKVSEIYFNNKYMKPMAPFFHPIDTKLQAATTAKTTTNNNNQGDGQPQQSG